MSFELLTPEEMQEADRRAIAAGPLDGYGLMLRAGGAVADVVLERFPAAERVEVLCGPGNNGGDGYVVARLLAERSVPVSIWATDQPRKGSDAERAAAECPIRPQPLEAFRGSPNGIVVDALYGAGLTRPLDGAAEAAVRRVDALGLPVVAVDVPSGVSGETGHVLGVAFSADLTVTFVRKKLGHLLYPGRKRCGELIVADIGVSDDVVVELDASTFENAPGLWRGVLPSPSVDTHKYRRGHVGVFSGGPASTGAARMAAMGAARVGAGAVTLLSPANAIEVNAAHLTSTILRKTESLDDVMDFVTDREPQALVFGPGLGFHAKVGRFAIEMIEALVNADLLIVFDADAITGFAAQPDAFVAALGRSRGIHAFLTPHEGEFARLFPDIAADRALSKLQKARMVAKRSGCTVVYKGPDTVIASPDGRAAINTNGTPLLATAGSGDVLAGFIAGLAAQGMPAFEAACAAVWMHAEAARAFGPGLIAEDLPQSVVPILRNIHGWAAMGDFD
jgi:hydroxyethylthiazole kinase-like uncharacterized protein yjeF